MLAQVLFLFFALVAIVSAVMTISRRNPVASALWLINTFFALASIYTLLGAFFIGVIQILVYAGAIMVLFLFVIMLLNLGNDFHPDLRGDAWKFLAGGAGLLLIALMARVFLDPVTPLGSEAGPSVLAAQVAEYGAVGAIGVPMFTEYVVHLQVAGLLLLVAVVGAVMLAKRNV
jgi:NADH-quinone oxidoreductase subunit J